MAVLRLHSPSYAYNTYNIHSITHTHQVCMLPPLLLSATLFKLSSSVPGTSFASKSTMHIAYFPLFRKFLNAPYFCKKESISISECMAKKSPQKFFGDDRISF